MAPICMDGNETPLHNRDEFQLERLILFTDAVFAIAITLLIIEIKVPELHHGASESAILAHLAVLTPKFVGFFVAFFIIAIYWLAHHRVFRFVTGYNSRLIWLNILFLLSIVLMPFTAAFQGEYPLLRAPWVLYSLSVLFTGFMQLCLQAYIRNPANGVAPAVFATHPDLDLVRPLVPMSLFVISILLCFTSSPWVSKLFLIMMAPAMMLYGRRYRRLLHQYEHSAVAA
ncbi:TMEM175 family protein [Hymenobacter wooponensis]|uniref:DUF1211 domain-containing protein n=1 Tax=Hymenobacter wooponensis TaxID=1525360 RepID=A0A4Z0MG63_9BACT|nr:TMEM175 family protein [Hymenobacter wooponensis]TGD78506.1 DUF1211 domain-containing protein [Hymenobacter wooponensis]